MPTVYKEIHVDVDLEDYDDDDLIYEIEKRGFIVLDEEVQHAQLQEVIDWYKRGNVKEALIQLERAVPDLYGISGKVKE